MLQTAFKNPLAGRLFWALTRGESGVAFVMLFLVEAYLPEHSVCPVSSSRIGWGVCRCYADNGTYPILFLRC